MNRFCFFSGWCFTSGSGIHKDCELEAGGLLRTQPMGAMAVHAGKRAEVRVFALRNLLLRIGPAFDDFVVLGFSDLKLNMNLFESLSMLVGAVACIGGALTCTRGGISDGRMEL